MHEYFTQSTISIVKALHWYDVYMEDLERNGGDCDVARVLESYIDIVRRVDATPITYPTLGDIATYYYNRLVEFEDMKALDILLSLLALFRLVNEHGENPDTHF